MIHRKPGRGWNGRQFAPGWVQLLAAGLPIPFLYNFLLWCTQSKTDYAQWRFNTAARMSTGWSQANRTNQFRTKKFYRLVVELETHYQFIRWWHNFWKGGWVELIYLELITSECIVEGNNLRRSWIRLLLPHPNQTSPVCLAYFYPRLHQLTTKVYKELAKRRKSQLFSRNGFRWENRFSNNTASF